MHPVRVAHRLVAAGVGLQLGQAVAAGWLLLRYNGLVERLGPWSRNEATLIQSVYVHLTGAFVLSAGLSLLLFGAALAVPRRTPHTRAVVGWALFVVTLALMLGIVYSPDSALLPDDEPQLRHLLPLLPLWYTLVQGGCAIAIVACSILAMARLGRDAAVDYYQRCDPAATWPGFTSWLDVRSQD
jgi:hypothetical protein